jgi:hypothetical protein
MAMTDAPQFDPEQFGAAFHEFLRWAQEEFAWSGARSEVSVLIREFLDPGAAEESVVTKALPAFEHVNLQTALDAWSAEPGREVIVHGISLPPHHGPVELQQLMTAEGMQQVRLSAPALVDLPNGSATTLACLRFAGCSWPTRVAAMWCWSVARWSMIRGWSSRSQVYRSTPPRRSTLGSSSCAANSTSTAATFSTWVSQSWGRDTLIRRAAGDGADRRRAP